jgi:hypothetical protein
LLGCGATIAAAFIAMARLGVKVGTREHLVLMAIASAAYSVAIGLLFRHRAAPHPRALVGCLLLALAARVPLVVKPAGVFDDMHRYSWDARLQRAGLNPYLVVPNDPKYAALHTPETRLMNNLDVPSPYPPGAQVFFRVVTAFGESAAAFKTALLASEVVTVVLLMSWLGRIGKEPAWVLAYAWHPVVIFETASAGHLEALGTMFVVASVTALTRRWRLAAAVTLGAAISVKLLPVVLAPLLFRRVRWTHALAAVFLLAVLYVPFLDDGRIPPGSLGAVADRFRFNQWIFDPVAAMVGTRAAAALALVVGLSTAAYLRARGHEREAAGWAWPVAAALFLSPLVYPWYLIWCSPFLLVRSTLPLLVWSLAITLTYIVWAQSRAGGQWVVPATVLLVEYGLLVVTAIFVLVMARRERLRAE